MSDALVRFRFSDQLFDYLRVSHVSPNYLIGERLYLICKSAARNRPCKNLGRILINWLLDPIRSSSAFLLIAVQKGTLQEDRLGQKRPWRAPSG